MSTSEYRTVVGRLLDIHASAVAPAARRRLLQRLEYRRADVTSARDLSDVVAEASSVVYLALPPAVVPEAVALLRRSRLAPGSRVVVEKPFGTDRGSAAKLEAMLRGLVDEPSVYRVDHFLHHQLLRDVLSVRFDSGLLEPLWSRSYVERVDVVWEEAAAVSGRGEYYDRTGALRDMVQSHLLQLLTAVAMDAPTSFEALDLRAARADLLARVRPPDPAEVAVRTLRGRYAGGAVARQPGSGCLQQVPAYVEEPGVDPRRLTETYARVDLQVAGPRWAGVPFTLRTGRAIGSPRRQVQVVFRATGPRVGVAIPVSTQGSTLTFAMGAAGVPGSTRLWLSAGGALARDATPWRELTLDRDDQPLPASALMLRDALAADGRWSVAAEEVDHCWRVVDAVLAAWRGGSPPLVEYPAGSHGPEPGP